MPGNKEPLFLITCKSVFILHYAFYPPKHIKCARTIRMNTKEVKLEREMEKEGARDGFFDSPLLPLGWRPMPVLPALIWNPAAGLMEKETEDLRMRSPKLVCFTL